MIRISLGILALALGSQLIIARNVVIPDPAFKAFLVTKYDTNFDFEISFPEASAVTGVLNCPNLGIEDLTGIEAFFNIEVLYCYSNNLTSLPDLTSIQGLRVLYCNNNQLTELPNLIPNQALETVFAYSNHLSKVQAFELLPLLDNLNLSFNDLDECDCPALALLNQKGMTSFSFSPQNAGPLVCPADPAICFEDSWFEELIYNSVDTNLDQWVQLSEIQNYTGWMNYNQQGFTSVTGMEYMLNLTSISLQFNNLKTLPDLSRLTQLTDVSFWVNSLEDVSGLQNVFSLERLDVAHNELTELPNLLVFHNLIQMTAINNHIRNYGNLAFPDQLESLSIGLNPLGFLPQISHLQNLTHLSCSDCNLIEIPELPSSGLIQYLSFDRNQLHTLPAIDHLTQLTYLNVSFNALHELPDLSLHPQLIYLFGSGNQLTSIPNLESLTNLSQVEFHHNRINSLPPNWPIPSKVISLDFSFNQLNELPDLSGIPMLNLNVANNHLEICPQLNGASSLQIHRNFLDEGDCLDLQKLHDDLGTYLTYNPQGNIDLTNPPWNHWPGPFVLLEWVALVTDHPYETILDCGF